MEHIELLEQLRPWDCEQFPKSKNICFGGGGGGDPITQAVKAVTKPINQVGSGASKVAKAVVDPVASAVNTAMDPVTQGLGQVGQGVTGGISGAVEGIGGGINQVGQGAQALVDPAGQALSGALERNIGQESAFGRAMSANMGAINEGISHNIKQVGQGANMIGNMAMGLLGMGPKGGGGGASASSLASGMGPAFGGLQRLGASKLQAKRAGMGRRQTYLTKG